jgi:DNA-3-methyladenine glycosylase II
VFARDDLGIQKAMIKIFKISTDSKKDFLLKIEKISSKWTPYRTYACLYLWKSLED